jgi:hypothetical protein
MAATTYYLCPLSLIAQWFTNIGFMAAGGTLQTYVGGTVATPVTTYTDSTGIVPNPNPMTLSSSGRPVSASGAPVAFWVPSGTVVKFVAFDVAGNQLDVLDNVVALGDPSFFLSELSNPATGFGADLVANAMRSYDVFSSLRAANVPVLTGSQTLIVDVEGALLIGDGAGGIFYWSPTSVVADDGVNTIKPNAILSATPGRYLRQTNPFGVPITFQLTITGCTTAPVLNCNAQSNGNLISVQVPGSGVLLSNSTAKGLNFWPATLRDNIVGFTSNLFGATDNGATGVAAYVSIANAIGSNSAVLLPNNASGLWTAGNTNWAFNGFNFTYILPNGHP